MRRALLLLCFLAVGARGMEDGVSPAAPPQEDEETSDVPGPAGTMPEGGPLLKPPLPSVFSGDLRARVGDVSPRSASFGGLSPDLRHGPAVSLRVRQRWEGRAESGALLLRPSPGPSLAAGSLRRQGVIKYFVDVPGRALAGNYSLSFGQGLLFYDHLGEFVRPAWVQGRGARPDLSGGRGNYLRGAVLQGGGGGWAASVFASRQSLDLPLNPDGTAAQDLWSLREGGTLNPAEMNTTEERMAGARLEARWGKNHVGVTAAGFAYAPGVEPPPRDFSDGNVFRGRRSAAAGADASFFWDGRRLALDVARSADGRSPGGGGRRGTAAAATLFQEGDGARAWASLFSYGAGYFARLGKGPAFEVEDLPASLPVDQRGMSLGLRGEGEKGYGEGEAAWAFFPSAQGNGRNGDPVFSSQGRRWRLEGGMKLSPGWDALLRFQERDRDRSLLPPGSAFRVQGEESVRKMRVETTWRDARASWLRTRCDFRWERSPATGRRAEGRLMMAEVGWRPREGMSLSARCYAFRSPEAYLTSGVEEVWDGVVSPLLPGGMGNFRGASGERYVLVLRARWGKRARSWVKWDENLRWRGSSAGDVRRSWRAQTDFLW